MKDKVDGVLNSTFEGVLLTFMKSDDDEKMQSDDPTAPITMDAEINEKVTLTSQYDVGGIHIVIQSDMNNGMGDGKKRIFYDDVLSSDERKAVSFGKSGVIINVSNKTLLLKFQNTEEQKMFLSQVSEYKKNEEKNYFEVRTDKSSSVQYFQFYGYLSQQQNMMQDYIRTSTYQKAVLANLADFHGKVVLDVGAGSGILSFFALQAGAKKVYAVEASNMAIHAQQLAESNGITDRLKVIGGKIEEIDLPEPVDTIISEPMGYMLFNERMLETYLHAKKWLKPNGKMYPSIGDLHVAPFSDEALYLEQANKSSFWHQKSFHGVNLTALEAAALKEYLTQPIVDTFDIRICLSETVRERVDFRTASEQSLQHMNIPLYFFITQTACCHGLAFWFDVAFLGSNAQVWLSTSPIQPLTHWYQVRCLVDTPFLVRTGEILTGTVELIGNKRQSYDVNITLCLNGEVKGKNTLDLKNPYFRYNGQVQHTTQVIPVTNNQTQPVNSQANTQIFQNWQSAATLAASGTSNTFFEFVDPPASNVIVSSTAPIAVGPSVSNVHINDNTWTVDSQ